MSGPVEFPELTSEQAAMFGRHVIAREPYLLRELASWMEQTGGPIEQMDGSLESLVPLWTWCIELATVDYLGLVDDQVPATWPELAQDVYAIEPSWIAIRRSEVLGDHVAHYIHLVMDRLALGACWDVYREKRGPYSNLHQQTVVFLPGWNPPGRDDIDWPVFMFERIGELTVGATTRGLTDPDRLRRMVARHCPPTLVPGHRQRQASVLEPYLHLDLPPMPPIARVTPALAWLGPPEVAGSEHRDSGVEDRGGWEEMVLATGPAAGLDGKPWLLAPLPVERVVAALRQGGFTDVEATSVLAEEEFTHPRADSAWIAEVAHVMTMVHDGALRALHIEPVNPTTRTWEQILAPLRMLALELSANLSPGGDYGQRSRKPLWQCAHTAGPARSRRAKRV
jgi:hypothetical protein